MIVSKMNIYTNIPMSIYLKLKVLVRTHWTNSAGWQIWWREYKNPRILSCSRHDVCVFQLLSREQKLFRKGNTCESLFIAPSARLLSPHSFFLQMCFTFLQKCYFADLFVLIWITVASSDTNLFLFLYFEKGPQSEVESWQRCGQNPWKWHQHHWHWSDRRQIVSYLGPPGFLLHNTLRLHTWE